MSGIRAVVRPSIFTIGFGAAIAVWWTWFVTHLPWLGISEQLSLPSILVVWLSSLAIGGLCLRREGRTGGETLAASAGAGLLSALLGLLILGTKLSESATPGNAGVVETKPGAALIAVGFVLAGTLLGVIAGGCVGFFSPALNHAVNAGEVQEKWMGRFGIVAAVCVVPLLVVGGLVTSTNSGMAVPDWPNTYGTNMFLYPLGPRADQAVYLEHSHRLFGALIGLSAISLFLLVLLYEDRRSGLWWWALAILTLVVIQGVLGGTRVLKGNLDPARDAKVLRVVHGVLAQFVFCLFVVMAVLLSPLQQRIRAAAKGGALAFDKGGIRVGFFRTMANAALHVTLLQLILGAVYRHTRSPHALWTHIVFSILVVIVASCAAAAAASVRPVDDRARRIVRTFGLLTGLCVGVQFCLGWVVFMAGGSGPEPTSIGQALLRTSHQANGALLLALVTVLAVWSRALAPKSGPAAIVSEA